MKTEHIARADSAPKVRTSVENATPEELKYFANANLAGNPGNMSVFNTAWK